MNRVFRVLLLGLALISISALASTPSAIPAMESDPIYTRRQNSNNHVQVLLAPSIQEVYSNRQVKLAKKRTWWQHLHIHKGRIKAILTVSCAVCVTIELLEEMINDLAFFKPLVGLVGVHHGVLFLTMSHLIHHITEFAESLETLEEAQEQAKKKSFLTSVTEKMYSSEIAAAQAYDRAALVLFGKSTALNFNENLTMKIDLDALIKEFSSYPPSFAGVTGVTRIIDKPVYPEVGAKLSKFRGVYWSSSCKAWQVPLIALEDQDDTTPDEGI
jgi:hypothetical protein